VSAPSLTDLSDGSPLEAIEATIENAPSAPAESGDGLPNLVRLPNAVERALVVVAFFILAHGLPMDWFRTRDDWVNETGNLRMVAVQLALLGLGVAKVAGSFDWLLRIVKVDTTVFILPVLAIASMAWSADPGESLRQAIIFAMITAYAAYLVLRFDLGDILELWAMAFSLSAAANLYFVFRLPYYNLNFDSWSGVFNGKNALGFAALIAIPVLVAAARNGSPLKWLYYASTVAFVVLLFGSRSKTMLLASAGTMAVGIVSSWFRGRKTLRGVTYLCLLTGIAFTITLTFRNLEAITGLLDKDVTFTGRVPLWQNLLPIAMDRPITGYGFKAVFTGYFGPVHEIWVVENWNPSHAHNEILNLWLQLGAAAVVTYLIMMGRAFRRSLLVIGTVPGSVAKWPFMFLASTLLVSITESGMTHAPIGWLMLAVAVLAAGDYFKSEVDGGPSHREPAQ